MKVLVVNTDYSQFTDWLYTQHPGLKEATYEEQIRLRSASLFGMADFLSRNLRRLGHEAQEVYFNNKWIQGAWARENNVETQPNTRWRFHLLGGCMPWLSRRSPRRWQYEVLHAQIRLYQPDVLLNLAMDTMPISFLQEVKPCVRLLVGWGEPPVLYHEQDWREYDLVLSPSEGMHNCFRARGVPSELLRFGFEADVLQSPVLLREKTVPVSFVGSLSPHHSQRNAVLEELCTRLGDRMYVWGPSADALPAGSAVRKRYQGPSWGRDLYRVLSSSHLTVNGHIDVAGESADNMRLYEATGVGTALLTDAKRNLGELFEPGREVIAYHSADECLELARHYLEHDDEREALARAGQRRTLRDHTYSQRMRDLVDIVQKYL